MSAETDPALRHEGVLTLGFLCAALGIAAAYADPATGYELSIYQSAPAAFWIGIGGGFLTALYVGVSAPDSSRLIRIACLLVTICGVAVVALPLLRSYFYHGSGDSLTHLGWAREIDRGVIPPTAIVYPGIHLLSIVTADVFGRDLTYSFRFVTLVLFPLVYVLFTALCVRYLTDRPWALLVGAVSAVLFVPINEVSVHVNPHPSSQAIMFAPLAIYVLIRFLHDGTDGFQLTTATGSLVALVTLALLFIHPQETLTFVSLLGGIWLVQLVVRRRSPDHAIAGHSSVFPHLVLIGAADLLWVSQHGRATGRFSSLIEGLLSQGPQTLDETAQRSASLSALGGGIEELFLKLFAGTLVFCLLAAALVLVTLRRDGTQSSSRRTTIITYLTFGLIPPAIGFLLVFVGNQGDHYFRYFGFIMVPVTLLGATALASLPAMGRRRLATATDRTSAADNKASDGGQHSTGGTTRILLGLLLAVLLVVQLIVIHPSPYMYQPNKQVPEAQMRGHATAFAYHDGETPFVGVRGSGSRFIDAEYGGVTAETDPTVPDSGEGVPGRVFGTNLSTHYDSDRYLRVMREDYRREIELYRGFRYSREGFLSLRHDPNLSRVQDNGGFVLYRLNGT